MKISGVKVHSEHDAEMGAGPDFGNVHYSASIDGKRHKFYTEALHNDVIDHMHHAEATGEVHPDLKRHIMHQYKDGEGEPVKKSTFSYPGQSYNDVRKSELQKAKDQAPNAWFHYDHPEHGKIEVSAHVPEADKSGREGIKMIPPSKDVKIHGVGALGDIHIDPVHDAGMSPKHMKAMKLMASKLGPGQHMK